MPRTIQALPQFPVGLEVAAYALDHQTQAERSAGRKPSGSPVATGTVEGSGEVTLSRNLSGGSYVLHAKVGREERFIQFRE